MKSIERKTLVPLSGDTFSVLSGRRELAEYMETPIPRYQGNPLLEALPPGQSLSLEREWLPRWIASERVLGFKCTGPFLDIGTPESYAAAESFFVNPKR